MEGRLLCSAAPVEIRQGFIRSENDSIRERYDILRIQLAGILSTLSRIRSESTRPTEALARLKSQIRESDIVDNGTIDRLIRERPSLERWPHR